MISGASPLSTCSSSAATSTFSATGSRGAASAHIAALTSPGKNMVYTASETRNEGRYKVGINGLEPVKCTISQDGYCCYDQKSKAYKTCYPNASECWSNCRKLEARV
uniref:Uncharacterized protein n=1 Tax=Oryza glumipatula TaxID=40148 RepID=A0A0E0AJ51_9ORYZ